MTIPEVWPFFAFTGSSETLEWFSDVMNATSGEQRLKLRAVPRQTFTYQCELQDEKLALARSIGRRDGIALVTVPVWAERVEHPTAIADTDTVISIDTTAGDFRASGYVVFWASDTSYVAAEISSLTTSSITLTAAIGTAFSSCTIMPARTAYMVEGVKFTRTGHYASVEAKFQVTDNTDLSGSTGYDTWNSLDVMSDRTVEVTNISETMIRAAEYVDNGFSVPVPEYVKDYADFGQTVGFRDAYGSSLWARRVFLHNRKGKQIPFWLPTWNRDLIPTADIGSADTTVTVTSIGATDVYTGRTVMMLLKDGTRLYKDIDSATLGSGTDTITLSSAFGQAIALTDIDCFCFMSKVRLDTDSVTINYRYRTHAETSFNVTEVPA